MVIITVHASYGYESKIRNYIKHFRWYLTYSKSLMNINYDVWVESTLRSIDEKVSVSNKVWGTHN